MTTKISEATLRAKVADSDEWAWAERPKPNAELRDAISELLHLDLSRETENKGRFTYLPWPVAAREMLRRDPDFNWKLVDWPGGLPYILTEVGAFVRVAVTFMGKTVTHTYAVEDHENKPITKPTSRDINTSQMRALVKACALGFGLALYLYEGENVPPQVDFAEADRMAAAFRHAMKQDADDDVIAGDIFQLYLTAKDNEPLMAAIGDRMTVRERRLFREYVKVGGNLEQAKLKEIKGVSREA